MPNLDFYAVGGDQLAVMDAVFELGLFRVYEGYSEPGNPLREFASPQEIPADPHGPHLMLYAIGTGPEPSADRIDLRPGTADGASFRYRCQGWGLIQLHFGNVFMDDELRWSHTNHNTAKRAAKWLPVYSELGDPASWEWPAVTRASGKLNRTVRSMAVSKIGSHPVLPEAAELISRAGMEYEYGMGVHSTPLPGMSRSSGRSL